jgi:2,3-dihydro-2,3-dihydroxybenzoate dehydrogenase
MSGVALVSGAANGIGAAVARALAEQGHVVAGIDVVAPGSASGNVGCYQVVARESASGKVVGYHVVAPGSASGSVVGYQADVSDPGAVATVVERIEAELGPIEVLVNVAGVLRAKTVAMTTDEDWTSTFAVNTTGVFLLSRAVTSRMSQRGKGTVVLVGSNAAGVPRKRMAAYAASKAAATMFTRCLGLELAEHGIRCNIVSPGSTDTDRQRALWGEEGARAVIEGSPRDFKVGIPLGRLADPADIADAVVFLVSDRARHITMQDLYVDGGATLRA